MSNVGRNSLSGTKSGHSPILCVRLPLVMNADLRAAAARQGLSPSELIRQLVESYLRSVSVPDHLDDPVRSCDV